MFNLAETYREFMDNADSLVGTPSTALEHIVEVLAVDPEMVIDEDTWQAVLDLHGDASQDQDQLVDLVISGLDSSLKLLREAMAAVDTDRLITLREMLEKYAFQAHWLLCRAEEQISPVTALPGTRGEQGSEVLAESLSRRPRSAGPVGVRCNLILAAFTRVVSSGLEAVLPTRTERDAFAILYMRPSMRILEHEIVAKDAELRRHAIKAICIGIKRQSQLPFVELQVVQLLCYYEHIAEVIVELIVVLKEQYDHRALFESMLKSLTKDWTNQDTGPKNVAAFISKLAGTAPDLILEQQKEIISFGDSNSQPLRSAVVEVLTTVVIYLLSQDASAEDAESRLEKIKELMELVMTRTNDVSHFVRSKAVQCLTLVVNSQLRINHLRAEISAHAVMKCKDRSQLVRRNAFRLMTALVETHPFRLGNGRLCLASWRSNLEKLENELESFIEESTQELINLSMETAHDIESVSQDKDTSMVEESEPELDVTEVDAEAEVETLRSEDPLPMNAERASEVVSALELQIKYHRDAVKFIEHVVDCIDTAYALLGSRSKADLIDAMDFFYVCKMYGVEEADKGIRTSVHLVWVTANNDEDAAVLNKLVWLYTELYFTPPQALALHEAALYVAGNLIELAIGSDLNGLSSLEKLFSLAEESGSITPPVVALLWRIYGSDQPSITPERRRGAAIILGMLAKDKPENARMGSHVLVEIGLGDLAKIDIELARYTAIILSRLQTEQEWKQSTPPARLEASHEIFQKLGELLLLPNPDEKWFAFAQAALRTINNLCEEAVVVFDTLLRAFHEAGKETDDPELEQQLFCQEIFVAGEIALNLAIDLDRSELMFKRRFREEALAKNTETNDNSEEDDLKMVGGSTEDDFSEAVREIRERELLFSDRAMLGLYARMVVDLCATEVGTPHSEKVGICLSLSLPKFMLVSSIFAEKQLPLMMQLAEGSSRPVIRANLVVAMGDLAMCFNPLIDKHTEFLYGRLSDPHKEVQRTAMTTLTNLILKGQIKVKGQIVGMARALESKDEEISRLAHVFFAEYSTKDNAIYNSFLDILSGLSVDTDLSDAAGERIVKYISAYVTKERQIKQLEERLLQRLDRCATEKQWNYTCYALNSLKGDRDDAVSEKIAAGFKTVEKVEDAPKINEDAEDVHEQPFAPAPSTPTRSPGVQEP
ncbi:Condensin complex subunit 1 [Wickerhamiella sorbophila]|uniref:Condensin complex subunit 1 n=1 Tax=Wickerhamiella sorbophila TaxID=45607 RepID=A0A2T0FCH7_9ASCO|nr:Condensin complex subunit 1 [Wickerhamiella sorbophila]PRT52713.1 Condensin complex subunit 1 [Wickerhamiella sorbophila]